MPLDLYKWIGRYATISLISPGFFHTMEIPLLRGRCFREGEKNAVILSESLARKRWPSEDPIGKQWEKSKTS